MKHLYIVISQNTKGTRSASTSNRGYSTREKANDRKDILKRQSRLQAASRAEKPEFWVEKILIPEGWNLVEITE